ncbi:MAG: universal stress protein [Gammaproteobacteria bacterium]
MYKQILVAVDGSDTANLAFQEAIKLAKEQQATVRLIYVADEYFNTTGETLIDYEQYEKAIREQGQLILNKLEGLAYKAGVKVESKLIEIVDYSPRISDKIVEESISWKADLIVIGTHGRRGFSRFILGSVAEGVIRTATIPVLLIRGTK